MELETYNAKIIDYGNFRQILSKPMGDVKMKKGTTMTDEEIRARENARVDRSQAAQEERTLRQSQKIKRTFQQLILANDFVWWATLTYDPKKVNSLNHAEAIQYAKTWLKKMIRTYGAFDYLLIPEKHKSGAIHFHGVFGKSKLNFSEAVNPKGQPMKRKGEQVFHLDDWTAGFSDCEKIRDKIKTSSYMTKYITKDLMTDPSMYHKARYIRSRGLKEPEITFVTLSEADLASKTPSFLLMTKDEKGNAVRDTAIYQERIDLDTGEIIELADNILIKSKKKSRPQADDSLGE